VVLLRGVNVGGSRSFRPARLAERLQHLEAVNIGATGTFVIRQRVTRAQLRAEIASELPFEAEIMVCDGQEFVGLLSHPVFADLRIGPQTVRFVSVLSRRPRLAPQLPMILPPRARWLVKILAREGRFVLGIYRRDMKVISCLGALDRIFGASATTRSWNTIQAIANAVDAKPA
jgi:uncharacterized protein (DUF1697 family)